MAESSQIHRLGLVQPCSSWECTERPVGRHSGVLSQVPGTDSLLEIARAVAGNEMNFASLCAWPWRPRISWEHCRPASSHASRLTSRVTGENDLPGNHPLSLEFPLRNTVSVGLDSPMMPAGSPGFLLGVVPVLFVLPTAGTAFSNAQRKPGGFA